MKSLGKKQVATRHMSDGEWTNDERVVSRTVYEDKAGDLYVNSWPAGNKDKLEVRPDGSLFWKTVSTSIRGGGSITGEELIARIIAKSNGRPISIVPMF